jgi:hypothetical protein
LFVPEVQTAKAIITPRIAITAMVSKTHLVASGIMLGTTSQNGLLDFGDCLGHLNAARAGLGAVEGGTAAPHALFVVQNLEANLGSFVARVKDKAVRVDDCSWAKVLTVCPEHWARGGAGCAEDALGGVIETLALFD